MKFKLLLLSVLLVSSFDFAQDYFPLEVGNEWHYWYSYRAHGGISGSYYYDVSTIRKEMMPNGREYYLQSDYLFSTPYKYFRNDSNKLFAYNTTENKEIILFDFTVPDTIDEANDNGIYKIDTVELFGAKEIILRFRVEKGQYDVSYSFNRTYGLIEYFYIDLYSIASASIQTCTISGLLYGVPPDFSNYLPLAVGNRWSYKISTYQYGQEENNIILDTIEVKILSKKTMPNNLEYFEFSREFPGTFTKYIRKDSRCMYSYDIASNTEEKYLDFSIEPDIERSFSIDKRIYSSGDYRTGTPDPVSYIRNIGLASYISRTSYRIYELIGFELADSTYGFIDVADDYENPIVTDYELEQNYPNPFNPETNISVVLPKSGYVKLTVYDLTGREISKLYQGELTSGRHNFKFDGTALSSGIYFYRLESSGLTQTKKMLLLK